MSKALVVVFSILLGVSVTSFAEATGGTHQRFNTEIDSDGAEHIVPSYPSQAGAAVSAAAANPCATARQLGNYQAIQSCETLSETSARGCKPPVEISMALMGIASAVQVGDMKSACYKAAIMQSTTATMALMFFNKCKGAANACLTPCEQKLNELDNAIKRCTAFIDTCRDTPGCQNLIQGYENDLERASERKSQLSAFVGSCRTDKGTSWEGLMSSITAGTGAGFNFATCNKIESQDKNKIVPPNCADELVAKTNSSCPMFCTWPDNKTHPYCSCDNPANALTDQCFCAKKEHKTLPRCVATKPVIPGGLPTPTKPVPPVAGVGNVPNNQGLANSLEEDIDGGIDQEYNPSGSGDPKRAGVDYQGQGGGGVGAFGGGSQMGGGGGGGAGEGPYNTQIDKGFTNGGGAVAGGGGAGYNMPSGGGGGYGAGEKDDKMDWKSLLPKVDKNRGPAGVDPELFANGITGANGLSNFEKVSRKMNEKRPTLLP